MTTLTSISTVLESAKATVVVCAAAEADCVGGEGIMASEGWDE